MSSWWEGGVGVAGRPESHNGDVWGVREEGTGTQREIEAHGALPLEGQRFLELQGMGWEQM